MLMETANEAVEEISRLLETLGRKAAAGENVILRSTAPGEDPNDLLLATHGSKNFKNACSRASLNMGKNRGPLPWKIRASIPWRCSAETR